MSDSGALWAYPSEGPNNLRGSGNRPAPGPHSRGRLVDQHAEAIAGEADEYVIKGGFPGYVRRRLAMPDALAVPLIVGRAVICQQILENQGFGAR